MDMKRRDREEGLGKELEGLLAAVPPPKAPAWFATKTMARLRSEKAVEQKSGWLWLFQWKWVVAGMGAILLIFGVMRWDRPALNISDAEVYAALNALVQEDEESRWWEGL